LSEPTSLSCSRCGQSNPPARLFCAGCGLGLQVLCPASGAPGDCAVGALLASGVLGAALLLALGTAALPALLWLLRRFETAQAARVVDLYLWRGVPALVAAGAAAGVLGSARRQGLEGRAARALGGSLWVTALGVAASAWAGGAALAAAGLLAPLGVARGGVGLFRSWLGPRRVLGASALLLGASAAAAYLAQPLHGRVYLDRRGAVTLVARPGSALWLEAPGPWRQGAKVPLHGVGAAWLGETPVVLLPDGLLQAGAPAMKLSGGPWRQMLRLGDSLVLLGPDGLAQTEAAGGPLRPLGTPGQGRAVSMTLGAGAGALFVQLEDGALLRVDATAAAERLELRTPPLAWGVTLDVRGELACGVLGRRVVCRGLRVEGPWHEQSEGLRAWRLSGLCALGSELLVGSDRGLFLGRGTPDEPFRLVAAGRFEALQACEDGALAVAGNFLYMLDHRGRWIRHSLQAPREPVSLARGARET
jgi:hypothetical protein